MVLGWGENFSSVLCGFMILRRGVIRCYLRHCVVWRVVFSAGSVVVVVRVWYGAGYVIVLWGILMALGVVALCHGAVVRCCVPPSFLFRELGCTEGGMCGGAICVFKSTTTESEGIAIVVSGWCSIVAVCCGTCMQGS